MSDNNRHLLLWIDTETTAIKPEDGQLLEIGMHITDLDGTGLPFIPGYPYKFSAVIPHSRIDYTAKTAQAIRMHQDNGLIDEVLHTEKHKSPLTWLLNSVNQLEKDNGKRITLHPAGTNVDFDLAWLKTKQVRLTSSPLWDDSVSYRKLDLSTVRLTLNAVGINPYKSSEKPTHRVNDCLNRDIFDWMHWTEWVQEHMKADNPEMDCDFGPSLYERFETEELR